MTGPRRTLRRRDPATSGPEPTGAAAGAAERGSWHGAGPATAARAEGHRQHARPFSPPFSPPETNFSRRPSPPVNRWGRSRRAEGRRPDRCGPGGPVGANRHPAGRMTRAGQFVLSLTQVSSLAGPWRAASLGDGGPSREGRRRFGLARHRLPTPSDRGSGLWGSRLPHSSKVSPKKYETVAALQGPI